MKQTKGERGKAKEAFFAQYWNQEILQLQGVNVPFNVSEEHFYKVHKYNNIYLLLKPLHVITDEDAIEVARRISELSFVHDKKWVVEHIENQDASYLTVTSKNSYHRFEIDYDGHLHMLDTETDEVPTLCLPMYLAGYDYLRSKGYALPYLNYSVDEMCKLGWIKLTE